MTNPQRTVEQVTLLVTLLAPMAATAHTDVPEPATVGLATLGGAAVGLVVALARRRWSSATRVRIRRDTSQDPGPPEADPIPAPASGSSHVR